MSSSIACFCYLYSIRITIENLMEIQFRFCLNIIKIYFFVVFISVSGSISVYPVTRPVFNFKKQRPPCRRWNKEARFIPYIVTTFNLIVISDVVENPEIIGSDNRHKLKVI